MRKQTFAVNILRIAVCEIHKNFQLYMSSSSRDMIACMLGLMGMYVPIAKFTDEQYATINQSTAGRFDPRVFVNCLQVHTYSSTACMVNMAVSSILATFSELITI